MYTAAVVQLLVSVLDCAAAFADAACCAELAADCCVAVAEADFADDELPAFPLAGAAGLVVFADEDVVEDATGALPPL